MTQLQWIHNSFCVWQTGAERCCCCVPTWDSPWSESDLSETVEPVLSIRVLSTPSCSRRLLRCLCSRCSCSKVCWALLSLSSNLCRGGWGRKNHNNLSESLLCVFPLRFPQDISVTPTSSFGTTTHMHAGTLMWSLAFISRLSVVCLFASGPKGTRDFKRSKHSRRCARLKREREKERGGRGLSNTSQLIQSEFNNGNKPKTFTHTHKGKFPELPVAPPGLQSEGNLLNCHHDKN